MGLFGVEGSDVITLFFHGEDGLFVGGVGIRLGLVGTLLLE